MKWLTKITDKPKQQITIIFLPKEEKLLFIGQYKTANNVVIDFVEKIISIVDIDLEQIKDIFYEISVTLDSRIETYEELNKTFKIIKEIDFKKD
jgi:hypothetical protein